MALAVLTENIRIGGFDKAHHLPTFTAWPERAKRGIDGNLWSREKAKMSYPCDACEKKLQCGRAPRTRQCDRRNSWGWHWQAWRRIIETSLAGCTAQPKRVSSRHVPGSTGKQDSNDGAGCSSCFTFLSTCSKDCGAHAAFSNVRRVTETTPSQNGNGNPRRVSHCWQVTKETPLPRKTRLEESEEVNDSKREQTHRGGIVRRAPREPFGAGKSGGPRWLLKMSHCKASLSVACAKLGAYQCSDS